MLNIGDWHWGVTTLTLLTGGLISHSVPLWLVCRAPWSSLDGHVSLPKFPIPSLGHPDLRVSAVVLHAVYRGHEIPIAYGEIKALHVLLPVAVPDDHVGCDGVHSAAHRVFGYSIHVTQNGTGSMELVGAGLLW